MEMNSLSGMRLVVLREERDGVTGLPRPTSSTDPMDVVLDCQGELGDSISVLIGPSAVHLES